ncbi:MAG: Gfo/Idh/MocA family oxidoreductase [Bacteroidetes bacterium]|nr:Gfo/Idh/MocA family oxidoreductase [Bacteroidota bacterium]
MIIETNSPLPKHSLPIVLIGAGGIANDAHLPAYKLAGFRVAGIYDINRERAQEMAVKFDIPLVYHSMEDLLAGSLRPAVFDVAVPGSEMPEVLRLLPEGSYVLMQKPMGENLEMAREILSLTREKKMIAGVNFQLRYAPYINAARNIISRGLIGDLCDIEVNVNVYTPWHLWKFLYSLPRVEILYHSIHYIDLIRNFLGNPEGIYARTVQHPNTEELASVRTSIIMDYGQVVRATVLTNHNHDFGLQQQQSYVKFEGTKGAIKVKMGSLMNYPAGVADSFDYVIKDGEWKTLDIAGSWFPHAFIGSMAQIMLAAEGSIARPDNSVEDAIMTMACVEAAYESSAQGGVRPEIG